MDLDGGVAGKRDAVRGPAALTVDVLSGPCLVEARVTVVRGGRVLCENVVVESGTLEVSASQATQERLSFHVAPDYVPEHEWSPFAPFGQTAHLTIHVTTALGSEFVVDRGWFLLSEAKWNRGGEVQVTAYSLLQRLVEDDFAWPTSPEPGAMLSGELARLCAPHLTVVLDAPDRKLPGGLSWGNKRVDSVKKLLDEYGLSAYVGADRQLHVVQPGVGQPVARYSGEDLALGESRTLDRKTANAWTAITSQLSGGGKYSAYRESRYGPRDASVYGRVHEVLQVKDASQEAAEEAAARALTEAQSGAETRSFSIVPDYRVDLGDVVSVEDGAGHLVTGAVCGFSMDCGGGAQGMRLDLKVRVV